MRSHATTPQFLAGSIPGSTLLSAGAAYSAMALLIDDVKGSVD